MFLEALCIHGICHFLTYDHCVETLNIHYSRPTWVLEEEQIELEEKRREAEHSRLQLSAKKDADASAVKLFKYSGKNSI